MSRLQNKCLIASAAMHALLGVVLLVGPAFFVEIKKKENLPILEVIPAKAVDEMLYGGGNPEVKVPPAAPPTAAPPTAIPLPPPPTPEPPKATPVPPPPKHVEPAPKPEPQPEVKPVPKLVDIPKPKTPKVKSDIPKPTAKKPEIKVNIDEVVTHKADNRKERQRREKEAAKAREAREAQETYERAVAARTQFAKQLSERADAALSGLRNNLSSGTTVEMPGPGGPGGPAFANYSQIIKSIYDQAWLVRDDVSDTRATVDASITIARDGTVLSARIIRRSGNTALDKSVQEALNRVKFVAPFPDSATEVERTFKLNFNLQLKRSTG